MGNAATNGDVRIGAAISELGNPRRVSWRQIACAFSLAGCFRPFGINPAKICKRTFEFFRFQVPFVCRGFFGFFPSSVERVEANAPKSVYIRPTNT